VRLAYITTHFPFGHDETFFEPEVRSLARAVDAVFVLPVRPRAARSSFGDLGSTDVYVPANGGATWRLALAEVRAHPRAVGAALLAIVWPAYRPAAKLKNLVLFPKALATAQVLRRIGVDHIHAQWITTTATVAMIASRLLDVPWSCTAHQHDIFFDNLIPQKLADAAFVRVISRRNAEFLIARAGPMSRRTTHVVHLGVDVPLTYRQRAEDEPVRLLCAARFASSKGHRYLIAAIALLAQRGIDVRCEFAGDGELREAILRQIATAGLGDVIEVRGVVQHATIVAELAAGRFDLAVLASTEKPGEHEGIPVALMEAMAAGVPCVTTETGSNSELIDASCGVLVPQRDAAALADAIAALVLAPELRRALGRSARERVRTAFETQRTTAQLMHLVVTARPRGTTVERGTKVLTPEFFRPT
jgi:glycosyltransferase involved in cell wall biosynthesis